MAALWRRVVSGSQPGGLGQKFRPDRYDLAGTLAGSVGVVVIMFAAGTGMSTEDRKALVHRLVAEVFNECRLEVLDELYEPARHPEPGRGFAPFRVRSAILSWRSCSWSLRATPWWRGSSARAPILVSGSGALRRTDDSIGWRSLVLRLHR